MSQATTAAAANHSFFPGYFSGNGDNAPPMPLMSAIAVPPPPPLPSTDLPPPPPPPSSTGLSASSDGIQPPAPPLTIPRVDTSVPPPTHPFSAEAYSNWALQWTLFQQAAAYQNQFYQSIAVQQQQQQQQSTAPPPPPTSVSNLSNGFVSQQQTNNSDVHTTAQNWRPTNSAPTFRPRKFQQQQPYRSRFSAPNNNSNPSNNQFSSYNNVSLSYNNVAPPPSLSQSTPKRQPQQPGIRFQLNIRPQTTNGRPGRRTRFSSPPKQQPPAPLVTPPESSNDDTLMDTTISAIQAFKMACDRHNWPDSLKKYWQSIELRCTTNQLRSQAEEWLQGVLVDAFQKNIVSTMDWTKHPFPEFLIRPESNPPPATTTVRSNLSETTNSNLLQLAKSSYAENKQREDLLRLNKLRHTLSESAQRAFAINNDDNSDEPTTASPLKRTSSSSTSDDDDEDSMHSSGRPQKRASSPHLYNNNNNGRKRSKNSKRTKQSLKKMQSFLNNETSKPEQQCERLEKRRNRFTNNDQELTSTIIKPIQAPGVSTTVSDSSKALVGTCQKLEKNYLRLTSEADPSTIRPLAILERAFSFVMDKYRLNKDWSYIGDQLKSIRQDLMVQSIRNDFTVLVYEENARIALEMGDREQFNQCQTQLEVLYDSGCDRTHLTEFLLYRLLYSLLLNDFKKTSRILLDIDAVKIAANGKSNFAVLDLALELCSAIRRKNYIRFFVLYRSLPWLASCLVNLFIDIYRKQAIKALVWGFAPNLPIDAVVQMLAYESNDVCQKHLSSLGLILIDESVAIDCKASRAIFEKK